MFISWPVNARTSSFSLISARTDSTHFGHVEVCFYADHVFSRSPLYTLIVPLRINPYTDGRAWARRDGYEHHRGVRQGEELTDEDEEWRGVGISEDLDGFYPNNIDSWTRVATSRVSLTSFCPRPWWHIRRGHMTLWRRLDRQHALCKQGWALGKQSDLRPACNF